MGAAGTTARWRGCFIPVCVLDSALRRPGSRERGGVRVLCSCAECTDVLLAHCINFNLRLENSDLSIPGRTEGQHREEVGREGGGVIYCNVPPQCASFTSFFATSNTSTATLAKEHHNAGRMLVRFILVPAG